MWTRGPGPLLWPQYLLWGGARLLDGLLRDSTLLWGELPAHPMPDRRETLWIWCRTLRCTRCLLWLRYSRCHCSFLSIVFRLCVCGCALVCLSVCLYIPVYTCTINAMFIRFLTFIIVCMSTESCFLDPDCLSESQYHSPADHSAGATSDSPGELLLRLLHFATRGQSEY